MLFKLRQRLKKDRPRCRSRRPGRLSPPRPLLTATMTFASYLPIFGRHTVRPTLRGSALAARPHTALLRDAGCNQSKRPECL